MDRDLIYYGSKRKGQINIKMYLILRHILLSRPLYYDRLAKSIFITSRAKQIQAIFHMTSIPWPGDQDASSQRHVNSRHHYRYSTNNTQMIVPRLLTFLEIFSASSFRDSRMTEAQITWRACPRQVQWPNYTR